MDNCANCNKSINDTKKTIVGGEIEENKWVCSDECYEQYQPIEVIEEGSEV